MSWFFFRHTRQTVVSERHRLIAPLWGEGKRWIEDRLKHPAHFLFLLFTFHSIGPQTLHFPGPWKMARKRMFSELKSSFPLHFLPHPAEGRKVCTKCLISLQGSRAQWTLSPRNFHLSGFSRLPWHPARAHAHSWMHYSGNISSICFWWPLQTHIEKPLIWSQIAFLFWWVEEMCIQASTVIPGRALGQRGNWDRREEGEGGTEQRSEGEGGTEERSEGEWGTEERCDSLELLPVLS